MQAVGQPFLHELVTCVRAPTCVLSAADGQIRAAGAHGLFHADVRHLAELVVTVDGREPVPVGHRAARRRPGRVRRRADGVGDPIADPTVRLERTRRATAAGFVDELTVVNDSRGRHRRRVDGARGGRHGVGERGQARRASAAAARRRRRRTGWSADGGGTDRSASTRPTATSTTRSTATRSSCAGRRDPVPPAGDADGHGRGDGCESASSSPRRRRRGRPVDVRSAHPALAPLVRRSLDDLGALLLVDGPRRRRLRRGRRAVVPDAVRPRLAVGGALRPAGRRRLAAGHVAHARSAAGDARSTSSTAAEPGKILHEVRAVPAARRPRPAAALLRHGRRDAAVDQPAPRRLVLGARRRRRRRAARPARRRRSAG